jgi:uncharacterized protein
MKSLLSLPALFVLLVGAAFAADSAPQIELRGMIAAGNDRRFALATPGGAQTDWVGIGDLFEGWKLADYHVADDSLVLTKNGRQVTVQLSSSVIGVSAVETTKATLADAEEVLNKMKFDQMMARMLEQQKKAALNMVKQMAGPLAGSGPAQDNFMAFQMKVMDVMFAELSADALRPEIARAYSEVFTKEELAAMANFYGTPAGQAMADKTPEMQQKMSEIMTPRIMAAMPMVQQLAKDFAAEQAKKKAAAPDDATATPAGK